jgi:DNA-binding NarL/FixJ family response regulator
VKILLVDDHPLFLDGMALILERLGREVEVLKAACGCEAIEFADAHDDIALALVDLRLPDMTGSQLLNRLRAAHPEIAIVVVSGVEEHTAVLEALELGAMGFIPKSSSSAVLLGALQLVCAGGIYLPPSVLRGGAPGQAQVVSSSPPEATHDVPGLSSRQLEVLGLLLQGKSNKIIARELTLSESTVKAHVSSVLKVLRVTTRTQAVVAAARLGLRFDARSVWRSDGRK